MRRAIIGLGILVTFVHLYALSSEYHRWTNLALQANGQTNATKILQEYLDFYHLGWDNVRITPSVVFWDHTNTVFVLSMKPPNPKQTIVFVHGYLDHVGNYTSLYEFLLSHNYAIVAMDLPGHGLSSGLRTGIEDFSDYASALSSVIQNTRDIPSRFVAMGFSTGASVWIEYLHNHRQQNGVKKILFISPLVRLANWNTTLMAYNIFGKFLTEIPRTPAKITANTSFLDFIYTKDPLQEKKIHLSWFLAARNWQERAIQYPPFPGIPAFMAQGREDSVVDWQYNAPQLSRLFPRWQLHLYHGNHQLLAETNREEIYRDILAFLEDV